MIGEFWNRVRSEVFVNPGSAQGSARVGLKVLLGVWIGRDRARNAQLVDTAVSLVKDHPGVVAAIIVGSEVLLRGDMTVGDLRQIIRSVKPRVGVPVTYADVWEFWLRYREVGEDVDFVTAHFLPYWEDVPPRAEDAAAHVDGIRKEVAAAFPGKEILIGETGWPSHGRMRDGALASRINQARFISQILERARQDNFRVNFFEAYDEPWKRRWEGTVGGYWGLFDGIERADSIAFDPHKWLYIPHSAGCVLIRESAYQAVSFLVAPSYIHVEEEREGHGVDLGGLGPQFSRGFQALKVWISLLAHGRKAYARRISHDAELARYMGARVEEWPGLELSAPVGLSI